MSGSVNKVILIGNLGRNPEGFNMSGGGRVVKFSLATSESWTKDGQRQERTTWHNVVIFDEKLGEVAEKYLRKGSKVFIAGTIQNRDWTDKDGIRGHTIEIVLQRFRGELTMLDSKQDRKTETQSTGSKSHDSEWQAPLPENDGGNDLDDEIPF